MGTFEYHCRILLRPLKQRGLRCPHPHTIPAHTTLAHARHLQSSAPSMPPLVPYHATRAHATQAYAICACAWRVHTPPVLAPPVPTPTMLVPSDPTPRSPAPLRHPRLFSRRLRLAPCCPDPVRKRANVSTCARKETANTLLLLSSSLSVILWQLRRPRLGS